MRDAARLVRQGNIGEPRSSVFEVKYCENWASWPWLVTSPRLVLLYDAIHILDMIRTLMGEPQAIESHYGRGSDDEVPGETWADVRIAFGEGKFARLVEDSMIPPEETSVAFRFEGDTGLITGTLGLYYDYPVGRPDSIKLVPRGVAEVSVPMQTLSGRWIPYAFSETMRALLTAIETGSEPENSGTDHLKTLRLVDSIYDASYMEIRKHQHESESKTFSEPHYARKTF
jgi:predicted dehydrogenase